MLHEHYKTMHMGRVINSEHAIERNHVPSFILGKNVI